MSSLYEKTLACVHCGLCLPACPAYRVDPRESLAPRGQVYNIRAVLEGRLELTPALASEIYDCLACRGCESVCPSGVPVGSIVEEARGLITEKKQEGSLDRHLKRLLLSGILAHPRRLSALMSLLRIYERSGLRSLARFLLARIAPALAERERLMPSIGPKPSRLPALSPASGETRGRVALFTGCIASHSFADVNAATLRVLQRNGFEVVVPGDQVCCGALHQHNGLPDTGRRLARKNVGVFEKASVDRIVVNAAGCGAALSEYGEFLGGDKAAHAFASRVIDVSALLVREGYERPSSSLPPLRVAYDAPCHLFHAQKVKNEPREILKSIPGVQLVEHQESERCCGSAGIYNVTHYRMSMEVLTAKMREIAKVRPDVIATGNPGCHIQLSEGVRRSGLEAEVVHPVVLLDRAYRSEAG
ncbi:MAG TPA: (Fe-S)-binding protein [Vicinamibacteria bacterium]